MEVILKNLTFLIALIALIIGSIAFTKKYVDKPSIIKLPSKTCCFQYGFGDEMIPCCLKTQIVSDPKKCPKSLPGSVGGNMGYTQKGCPKNAAEAAKILG